jgi:hypothetical protein
MQTMACIHLTVQPTIGPSARLFSFGGRTKHCMSNLLAEAVMVNRAGGECKLLRD